jgi:hypothetical protein
MNFYDDIDEIINNEDYALLSLLRKKWPRQERARDPSPKEMEELGGKSEGMETEESGEKSRDGPLDVDMDPESEEGSGSHELGDPNEETEIKLEDTDVLLNDAASLLKTFSKADATLWEGNIKLPSERVYLIKQSKDGTCLYTSIAEWLDFRNGVLNVQDLASLHSLKPSKKGKHNVGSKNKDKRNIANYLNNIANDFIVKEQAILRKANIIDMSDVEYAIKSKEGNRWGGMSQIYAISLLLHTPIAVWTKEEGDTYKLFNSTFKILETIRIQGGSVKCTNEEKCIIHLFYVNSHYDTLIVTDAKEEASA